MDRILAECEAIGAELRTDIARWTHSSSAKGKSKSRDSSATPDLFSDGSLSLRSQNISRDYQSGDFLSSQPTLLSSSVTLKEYQLLGINWLHLLYRKRLSCILADEMGTSILYRSSQSNSSGCKASEKPSKSSVSSHFLKSVDVKALILLWSRMCLMLSRFHSLG